MEKELDLEIENFNNALSKFSLSEGKETLPECIQKIFSESIEHESNDQLFLYEALKRYLYYKNNKLYNELMKKEKNENYRRILGNFIFDLSIAVLVLFRLRNLNIV